MADPYYSNPRSLSPRNGVAIESRRDPPEYSRSVYDGVGDKFDRSEYGRTQYPGDASIPQNEQSYNQQQYSRQPPVESQQLFEVKLMAPKGSPPRGKGTSISRLYDDDPVRHHQEKVSRQLDYNRQLQEQVKYRFFPLSLSYFGLIFN
jgi:hypothetical protein